MFGSETLTIVTSMISSSVAVMTAMLMITLRAPCSTTGLSNVPPNIAPYFTLT